MATFHHPDPLLLIARFGLTGRGIICLQHASAHVAAALGTVAWVEMDSKRNPLFELLLPAAPRVVEGRLQLGDGAGLGIEVPERVLSAWDVTGD
jgi:L-alanine-DL-glutamate epimerase-like enolase superfamily enzyme